MLLTRPVLERIRAGEVDLVFRRWRRPTVRSGGTLRTVVGVLDIHEVAVVEPDQIDAGQALRAGYPQVADLLADLFAERPPTRRARQAHPDPDSPVYRVRVGYRGADPRVALRGELLDAAELVAMLEHLRAVDAGASRPWAFQALGLVAAWPGRRAPELAELAGWPTAPWKAHVRRLKELGLTESLPVGYVLSPRGEQLMAALRDPGSDGG